MKKLNEIIAATEGVPVPQRTERILKEIHDLGDDAPSVSQYNVLLATMQAQFEFVLNMHIEAFDELGLLPDGKKAAVREMRDGLKFIEAYTLYEQMEQAAGDE